ncbi:MAG: hypothetical protein QOI83_284, partial [Streptomycetaceae bacterium]|nr:hypothetical protein [Streptomycetaceae bacterium]
ALGFDDEELLAAAAESEDVGCGGHAAVALGLFHDPERALRRITRQANALGMTVRFEPIEAA